MEIDKQLDLQLHSKRFHDTESGAMEEYLPIARAYAQTENAIAVMSNLQANVSHIYYGALGERLGIAKRGTYHRLDTIWEEEILRHVHPDDLRRKQLGELNFFNFVRKETPVKAQDYLFQSMLRMNDGQRQWVEVLHRICYFLNTDGQIWLALCLYTLPYSSAIGDCIFDSSTGMLYPISKEHLQTLLSQREKAILRLIRQGLPSKIIAEQLSISIHTVNRHRQNILDKLNCNNSIEACNKAKELRLI